MIIANKSAIKFLNLSARIHFISRSSYLLRKARRWISASEVESDHEDHPASLKRSWPGRHGSHLACFTPFFYLTTFYPLFLTKTQIYPQLCFSETTADFNSHTPKTTPTREVVRSPAQRSLGKLLSIRTSNKLSCRLHYTPDF